MGRPTVVLIVIAWIVVTLSMGPIKKSAPAPPLPVKKSAVKPPITLAFVGDVLLAGGAGRMMEKTNVGYPFAKVKNILKDADIAFANLECALTGKVITRNVRTGKGRYFVFKTPPRFAKALTDAGIDIVTLANNHSFNGGEIGLLETMRTLKDLQIHYTGLTSKAIQYPLPIEAKEWKVGFLGYTDIGGGGNKDLAIARLDPARVLQDIKAAKKKADLVIVSYHWGKEGSVQPTARQKTIARQSIDAGADLVIGHHPHVLQPLETYHGRTIAYSLGNFVFDNPRPLCSKTMILKVTIDFCGLQNVKVIPCQIKNSQPTPITKGEKR